MRRNTIIELTYRAVKRSAMRIIVLPVGRGRFLEENESGLRFRRDKICGLRNVRPPIIDPQLWVLLERHAIFAKLPCQIDSTITKYIGHDFTKVTTFIIIIIKNNYKNCYLGKIMWEDSLV